MSPFLRNQWYTAATSAELGDKPLARTICNEPLVIFRSGNGNVAVLTDRCPHRKAPLSSGEVVGNDIQCGYHGIRFAPDGAAEIARDVRSEHPLPEQPDEVACQQHHCERDQQSLPKWHGHPPRSVRHGHVRHLMAWMLGPGMARCGSRRATSIETLAHHARYHAASMTGSRPTSRANWRSRTNTRSPASALNPFSKRSTKRPRSTTIGVFGNTPVVEAEIR